MRKLNHYVSFDAHEQATYKRAAMGKPVHALVGADVFLQLEALRQIVRDSPADAQRIEVDGETAELADVLDELRSFAMFSSSKLLIVRNADEFISRFRAQLEEYVSKPAAGSTLVLRVASLPGNQRIAKLIAKAGQIHECSAPKDKDLPNWIIGQAKGRHKLTIRPEAARVLADYIGADLGRLDNELAKLALQTEGTVEASAITASVAFQREQEMWDMTNELAAGQVTSAVRRWRQLVQLDSSAEFRAVTWLTMWLEKVRKALALRKQGLDDYTIAREAKIFPANQVQPFMKTATTLGEAGAARLIEQLAEIDLRSKSGLGEMAQNVERFLLNAGAAVARR